MKKKEYENPKFNLFLLNEDCIVCSVEIPFGILEDDNDIAWGEKGQ